MDEIKVSVVEFSDRKHYQVQYIDPMTGKYPVQRIRADRPQERARRRRARGR